MYNILVVGTGYVGQAVAEYYVGKKQRVYGVTRSQQRAETLRAKGIRPVVVDLLGEGPFEEIPSAHFILISLAPDSRDEESYFDTYMTAVRKYLDVLKQRQRPFLIVYLSSTGIWDQSGLDWVDEKTPVSPVSKRAKILQRAELQILESEFPATVLRLSGIYGPGRNRIKTVRAGDWPNLEEQNRYMNMIHRDDIAQQVIPQVFKEGQEGSVYVVSDDKPVPQAEFFPWIKKMINFEYSDQDERHKAPEGKRLKNDALKALGVELKFPTYRQGYEELLKSGKS